MFYKIDHEWIDFKGLIAYVGISNFKFPGIEAIHEIRFKEPLEFARRGEVLLDRADDYRIEVHMPVDGWILKVNGLFLTNDFSQILERLQKSGWMVSITPVNASERNELISCEQYHTSIIHDPNQIHK
jgi:glycine cleavage system H lipoate-binding protein